ncbi:MAG: reverse transcriptase/maturase family protein [Candidatus Shapirobacteria bacterium]|nr:reverse transcriptase/maturase family protein [Candidatus Shapirobacteria bacterium]
MISLYEDLITKTYRHGGYFAFKISDPKPRDIHKASLRDRIVHHALHRSLYPYFDRQFIFDSYSCRMGKGTYKAMDRARSFGRKASQNNTKTTWILKGDIRKFFASVDHAVLKNILKESIKDPDIMWLLEQVIDSFETVGKLSVGLPLGNLTSQLLVNIYMNQFDQFVKRKLKVKYYLRYADDFLIFSQSKIYLEELIPKLSEYLETNLKLSLHPKKVFIKTLASGIDFLGWVHFGHHRILRTATKHHMLKRLRQNNSLETLNSYLGLLRHGNTYKLSQKIMTESLRDKENKESKNQNP